MPFEFGDQPDYCDTDTLPRYWDLAHSDMEVSSGTGYGGADGWTASGVDAYLVRYPPNIDLEAFGFVVRLYIDTLPGAVAILLGAVEVPDGGSPALPRLQVCCVLNPDGTVSIYRGDVSGTLLATSADAVPTGEHVRIGFSGTIDPVNGIAKVWLGIDGTDDALHILVQALGVGTDAYSTGHRRGIYMGGTPDLITSYLYTQGAGTLPRKPLCDVLYPDDTTDLDEWVPEPSASTPNVIDETPADDDTTFLYSGAVDQSFAVTHETLPSREQILGTRLVATVENDADPCSYTPLVRRAGGTLSAGPPKSVSTDWIGVDDVRPVSPFTGLPWTTAEINTTGWGGRTTL